jgi:hypothetical protein
MTEISQPQGDMGEIEYISYILRDGRIRIKWKNSFE